MLKEQFISDAIAECNTTRTSTFAEFIARVFKGKFVEIYLSDSYEEVSMEQTSMNYPAVFCGEVVDAYRECLIIKCAYVKKHSGGKSGSMQLGNLLFISERAIKALNEIDGNGTLEDMFMRSKESILIKEYFEKK